MGEDSGPARGCQPGRGGLGPGDSGGPGPGARRLASGEPLCAGSQGSTGRGGRASGVRVLWALGTGLFCRGNGPACESGPRLGTQTRDRAPATTVLPSTAAPPPSAPHGCRSRPASLRRRSRVRDLTLHSEGLTRVRRPVALAARQTSREPFFLRFWSLLLPIGVAFSLMLVNPESFLTVYGYSFV